DSTGTPSSRRVARTSSRRAFSSAAHSRTRGSDPGSRRTRTHTVSTGPRVRRMKLPLEAVPNFSEGRDTAVIKEIGRALAERSELLDVHTDADHNRTVFTLIGGDRELVDALVAGIAVACDRIDLRRHEGVHPRIGAADVVPIVPVRPEDMKRARAASLELARRVGKEVGVPVFLYGEVGAGRGPAFFRRGGPLELQRRIDAGELAPDFGPSQLGPAAGGAIVRIDGFDASRLLELRLLDR